MLPILSILQRSCEVVHRVRPRDHSFQTTYLHFRCVGFHGPIHIYQYLEEQLSMPGWMQFWEFFLLCCCICSTQYDAGCLYLRETYIMHIHVVCAALWAKPITSTVQVVGRLLLLSVRGMVTVAYPDAGPLDHPITSSKHII